MFRKFAIITVAAVIFLIFVGSFVRASGAGMGCPDWPKCFGMWVPPTSVEQLPANYQEIFGAKLKGEVEFNATKTWIEYVNRLVGVSVGLFIMITVFLSYRAHFSTANRNIFYITFISFLLVLFEGWLGAKVVSSELHPGMITLHMVVAVFILGLLIWAVLKSYENIEILKSYEPSSDLRFLLFLALVITISQIVFGTQIREGIDIAEKHLGRASRDLWINQVKGKVIFHAGISMVVLGIQILIFKKVKNRLSNPIIRKFSNWGIVIVISEVLSGAILALAGLPAILQPFHLTFSVVIISIQFVLYFILSPNYNK